MKRLVCLGLVLASLLLVGGCIQTGYYHTHACVCPDGQVRTLRHWHASTGYAGYHPHPFPNDVHKTLMMSGKAVAQQKGVEEHGKAGDFKE